MKSLFGVCVMVFPLTLAFACSSQSEKSSASRSSPASGADAVTEIGSMTLSLPPLDASAGVPDRITIKVQHQGSQTVEQSIEGPFQALAVYKVSTKSGKQDVTVTLSAADKLIKSGLTTVEVAAGKDVAAVLNLTDPADTGGVVPPQANPPPKNPADPSDTELRVFNAPCGNGQSVSQSCEPGDPEVAVATPGVKTCEEVGMKVGDRCDGVVPSCISKSATACTKNQNIYTAAYRLICTSEQALQRDFGACPVSRREAKQNIRYMSEAGRSDLSQHILGLKIARYDYKPEQGLSDAAQLGFIIDDYKDLPFLTGDRGHVNMYAYVSALVVTIQEQQRRIDALEKSLKPAVKK